MSEILDLIERKKRGEELSVEQVAEVTQRFAEGEIPDYQMSALLMAWVLRGMSEQESAAMALAVRDSGDRLEWPGLERPVVDKHSTGGVGDKVTLLLAPWLACCGLAVPKLSGRGLGFTGGTIDKLEAVPGFRTDLSLDEVRKQVAEIGVAVYESGGNIAPADHEIYTLRDVTGTVDSPGLIAASIMGKKLAGGASHIVIDLKVGEGAFTETSEGAEDLATHLAACGRAGGVSVPVVMTAMDRPLGRTVGNGLEVAEGVSAARDPDTAGELVEVAGTLGMQLVCSALDREPEEARKMLNEKLASGAVLEKMDEWFRAQSGGTGIEDFEPALEKGIAENRLVTVRADRSGWVAELDARGLGELSRDLGAGRKQKGATVDPWAGIELRKTAGEEVQEGEKLAVLYGGGLDEHEAERRFRESVAVAGSEVHSGRRVLGLFGG